MKYWINVVSKDHVLAGMAEGFVQAGHGKPPDLRVLNRGDVIFFYSPGTLFRAGALLQAFTAVGRVADDAPYQVETAAGTFPWRRNMTALACEEAPIEPLVPELSFIPDKTSWATSLPRGMFEIGTDDARRIASAMKADIAR